MIISLLYANADAEKLHVVLIVVQLVLYQELQSLGTRPCVADIRLLCPVIAL